MDMTGLGMWDQVDQQYVIEKVHLDGLHLLRTSFVSFNADGQSNFNVF